MLTTATTSTAARMPSGERGAFARDLVAGLGSRPRTIAAKYFYDAEGSALFERICRTPEYYPARVETRILAEHAREMAGMIGADADLVEFGAGSLEKIRLLLGGMDAASASLRYVPVDISRDHLAGAAAALQAIHPALRIVPVAADFTQPFALPDGRRRVGFFPGSTLGNFHGAEARALLRRFAGLLRGGGLLLGIDLVKDPAMLHAAYNDAGGVTAAFNLNLLARANRELGADFDLRAFHHYACYQPMTRRVEMHLVSAKAQRVTVGGRRFAFAEGDAIHTENSYKYSIEAVRELASASGFRPAACWTDPERLFSVHWLETL